MQAAALDGLKVVEMGQLIAGPFAGKTLGEFGAEVIKIEAPGAGDPLRNWRLIQDGTSVWWQVQSRNKRSIALDLRAKEGQVERYRALVAALHLPPHRGAILDQPPIAQRVAHARRLDLDHVSAKLTQRLAGKGAGNQLAHLDDLQSVQGSGLHRLLLNPPWRQRF